MKKIIFLVCAILMLAASSGFVLAQDSSLVVYHDGITSGFLMTDGPRITFDAESNILSIVSSEAEGDFALDDIEKMTIEEWENTSPEIDGESLPVEFAVLPAYPNPFNSRITVPVALPQNGMVKVVLVNIMGQQVSSHSQLMQAGMQKINLELSTESGEKVTSGIYFLQVSFHDQIATTKLVLVR
ncbi:T9SS type A sorting domain-containing protein [Calditrichota bacterium]